MAMMDELPPLPGAGSTSPDAHRALGEIIQLRARGQTAAALERCRQAVEQFPESWELQELYGDLLVATGGIGPALQAYRRALAANPSRGVIEEKIGRTVLRQAAGEMALRQVDDIAAGRVRIELAKRPAVAGMLSAIVPGVGQMYNEQFIKGGAMFVAAFILWVLLGNTGTAAGPRNFLPALTSGVGLFWSLLYVALVIYAVVDASLTATSFEEAVTVREKPPRLEP
jgi:tetratricopeptide (TPR) repeat protein